MSSLLIVGGAAIVLELEASVTEVGAFDVEVNGLAVAFEDSEVSGLTVFSLSAEGHSRLNVFAVAGSLSRGSGKSNRKNEESSKKLAGEVLGPDFFGVGHLFKVGLFGIFI